MREAILSVTDGPLSLGASGSGEGRIFTADGFLHVMAHARSDGTAAPLLVPTAQLAPVSLDEHPDPATAWVVGFYALALMRRPEPAGLEQHASALRNGVSPCVVLDGIMASPEAVLAGTSRPELAKAYVTGAYLAGLGRLPDPQGLAMYVTALANGMSEGALLDLLLTSEEARSQLRFPPAAVDVGDLLAEKVQTVALGVPTTAEQTAWAREALREGAPPRQVVRSLARRVHGVSRAGVSAALTARWRAARAARASVLAGLEQEILRERAWQWRVQRSTWERLDRLEQQLVEMTRSTGEQDLTST